jgi:hypothetical protein
MILQPLHPSYLRFVQTGETTLPEFWRDDARSRNHDMMGHIMEWFYSEVAGIKSDDAFKTVTISPWLTSRLDFVKCCYHSIRGKIVMHYCRNQNIIQLELTIPANVKAVVHLKGDYTIQCNRHEFKNGSVLNGGIYHFEIKQAKP